MRILLFLAVLFLNNRSPPRQASAEKAHMQVRTHQLQGAPNRADGRLKQQVVFLTRLQEVGACWPWLGDIRAWISETLQCLAEWPFIFIYLFFFLMIEAKCSNWFRLHSYRHYWAGWVNKANKATTSSPPFNQMRHLGIFRLCRLT